MATEWTKITFKCGHWLLRNESRKAETTVEEGRWPRRNDHQDCPNCGAV